MMSKFYLDNKPYLSLSTFFISLQEWRDIMKIDFTNKRFGKIVCVKPLRVNNHKEVVWL